MIESNSAPISAAKIISLHIMVLTICSQLATLWEGGINEKK